MKYSMARYITNPETIDQKNLTTGESLNRPLTFKDFVVNTLLTDVRFIQNFKTLRSAHNILDAINKGEGKAWTLIEDADYDMLREVAEEPHYRGADGKDVKGYPGSGFIQAYPLIAAIMEATAKEPT